MEEVLQPLVEKFVADQRGFYRDHASNEMLVALLMWRLSGSPNDGEKSRAELILEGDPNAAYDAACPIFERVLEHGARAGGNGHHRAQHFAEAMSSANVNNPPALAVGSDDLVVPCECSVWARLFDGDHDKGTNHHPNCPRVDESLIDVWRVECDGRHYYTTEEPNAADLHEEEVVTKEKMHREIFDRLPDFAGF